MKCADLGDADEDLQKCDGVRPKCSGCEELGFECVYVNPASSSNVIVGKEYLSSLEDRLKVVEQDVKLLKSKRDRPQQHPRFNDGHGEGSSHGQSEEHRRHTTNLLSEEVEVNSDEIQDSFDHENSADGMGAMVFSAEEDCGFFGDGCRLATILQQANIAQGHPQILHLRVIYHARWLVRVGRRFLQGTASAQAYLSIAQSSVFLSPHHRQPETPGRDKLSRTRIGAMPTYMLFHQRPQQETLFHDTSATLAFSSPTYMSKHSWIRTTRLTPMTLRRSEEHG